MMGMFNLSIGEINLLLDALARAASRHESMAASLRPGSFSVGEHDRKAQAMRKLRVKIMRIKADVRPVTVEVG